MTRQGYFGYERKDGYSVVLIRTPGRNCSFALAAHDPRTLPDLEARLTPELLLNATFAPNWNLFLKMPRFKMEPGLMRLAPALKALGMRTAFDEPEGSANFDAMAPRRPDDYLCISNVYHKTFLDLDEGGTEAAAATAVSMIRITGISEPKEVTEVKIDRPFLFAIQHRPSGACLFLGRVHDPRSQ